MEIGELTFDSILLKINIQKLTKKGFLKSFLLMQGNVF